MLARSCLPLSIVCLLFGTGASHSQLRAASSEPLGIRIGRLVRAGAEAADAQHPQFRKAFAESWMKNHKVLVNKNASEVIARANFAADSASAASSSSTCARHWMAPCPDGWTHYPESGLCRSPILGGLCSTLGDQLSVAEKQQASITCAAPWPCRDACAAGKNYATPCPDGWDIASAGFCKARGSTKSRNCPSVMKSDSLNVGEKQDLSQRCDINWPCLASCLQNFGAPCPEHWQEVESNPGVCVAPATYTGGCDFMINTNAMSQDQKKSFASRCSANFPCVAP